MNKILYLKEVPFAKKLFGFVILILGLYFFIYNIIMGSIFIAIGLNLIYTEGSEINLDNNTYRNLKSIFGIHFGKWKPCPQFEYVSVFKTKENQTINVISATTTITSDIIYLNLFYNKNKHFTFYKTEDKADAFKIAKKIQLKLGIDVLDATEKESKWVED